jgi:hypothetical protein
LWTKATISSLIGAEKTAGRHLFLETTEASSQLYTETKGLADMFFFVI